jgi:hypothetical protein
LILVLSNVANEAAPQLVEMFPPGAASLVTASTLHSSFKGAVSVGDFLSSQLVINGARISAAGVSGVISSIAYFLPQEFYYIEPADREYVRSEVSAFFIYFLSELRCKKLNPPTSKALCGLGMHRLEWMKTVHRWDIPVWPIRLKDGLPVPADPPQNVGNLRATIVGNHIVEERTPDRICDYLRALSQAFSLPYLCADFASPRDGEYFLADLWSVPDLTLPANRDAIVRFMGATQA